MAAHPTDLIDFLRFARDNIAPDVTVQRVLVLLSIARYPGLSQSELGKVLPGISVTALSRNIADLSLRTSQKQPGPGLVELRPDPNSLRRKRVFLTDRGRRFVKRWERSLNAD